MTDDEPAKKTETINIFEFLGLKSADDPFTWLPDLLKPIINIFQIPSPFPFKLFSDGKGPEVKQFLLENIQKLVNLIGEKTAKSD